MKINALFFDLMLARNQKVWQSLNMQETIHTNHTEFLNEKEYNHSTGTKTLTQRAKAARKAEKILSDLISGGKVEYYPNTIDTDCGQFFVRSENSRFYINFYGEVNSTVKGVEVTAERVAGTVYKRVTVKEAIHLANAALMTPREMIEAARKISQEARQA